MMHCDWFELFFFFFLDRNVLQLNISVSIYSVYIMLSYGQAA